MGFTTKTDQEINQVIQTLSKEFTGTTDHSTLSCTISTDDTKRFIPQASSFSTTEGYKIVDIQPSYGIH